MGIPIGGVSDVAAQATSGTLSASTAGVSVTVRGQFNLTVYGVFVATLAIERSFDGGITWLQVTFSDGSPVTFTAPASGTWSEPEAGVLFRFHCTSYTSGTVSWRISQ